jgi:hypothetical protein
MWKVRPAALNPSRQTEKMWSFTVKLFVILAVVVLSLLAVVMYPQNRKVLCLNPTHGMFLPSPASHL